MLGRGGSFPIRVGDETRDCREWLLREASWRPLFRGAPICEEFEYGPTFLGDMEPGRPLGLEGHFCQWLFIMQMIGVDESEVVRVGAEGREASLGEFVQAAAAQCTSESDLSWALPVLACSGRRSWRNRFGETVTLDGLAAQHLARREASPACFGTHWYIGLAVALRQSGGRFSAGTRASMASVLEEGLARVSLALGADGLLRDAELESRGLSSNDRASFQAHTLQWVLWYLPTNRIATEPAIWRAVEKLAELADAPSVSYTTRCHAAYALRLFLEKAR
jgi:hypothetical protein